MIDIKMTSARAVLGFVLPFAVVLTMVLSGIDIFIALIAALAVLVIYGMILGAKLKDMEKAMANGASAVIGAVLVVILVGGLIGVWMACGSVPAMLYYGIKLINPQMFLPLAFIICSITSLAGAQRPPWVWRSSAWPRALVSPCLWPPALLFPAPTSAINFPRCPTPPCWLPPQPGLTYMTTSSPCCMTLFL